MASHSSTAAFVDPPPEATGDAELPLTTLSRSIALTVIAVIVVFFTLYFAASLLAPIAAAVMFSMLLSPAVQLIEKLRVPRLLAAAIVVVAAIGIVGTGTIALLGPAQTWMEKAPESLRKIEQKLFAFRKPFAEIKKATDQLQEATQAGDDAGPQEVRVVQPALTDLVLSGTPQVAVSIISVIILSFLLLASGDVFLRKLVTVIPSFRDKKRAVEITRQIETDISFYLLSFTAINVCLGAAMAIVAAVLGIPNPLLWGVLVTVLNFVPYVGALTSVAVLTLVGVQTFDSLTLALAAPAILFVLVGVASQGIQPFVVGRRLLLNPVAIFIAILLWGWLWGLVGVLLAVPLLASFKIICERVEPLNGIAEFLTT